MRAAFVFLTVLAVASPALAQPNPPQKPGPTAASLLADGKRLYAQDADYAAALEAFLASYALDPSWQALSGIGSSQTALGRHVAAYKTYQKLLADFGDTLDADKRAGAERRLAELDKMIGRVSIKVVGDSPELTRVTLDGAAIAPEARAEPRLVLPGNHAVVATRDGFQPFAEEIVVKPGEAATITVELQPEKEKIVVKVEETPLVRRMPVWIPWATIAGGAVLAGAGTLFAISASGDYDEFDDQVAAAAGEFPEQTIVDDSAKSRGDTKAGIATGLFITGGVAAAAGVTLLILNQPRRAKVEPRTDLVVTPRSVGVRVRF